MELRAEFTTLAERLSEAGYQTAGFSENPLVSDLFGFEQGFEQFSAITIEDVINEDERPGSFRFDLVDEVAAFAAERDRSRPFFLFANLFDPHSPYRDRKPNRFIEPGVSVGDSWTVDALKASPSRICDRLPAAEDLKLLHGLYLGDVAAADAKLGEISAIAREMSGENPLIIVATADHGEHFGEHRLLDHEFSVRAPVLNVPLAVHGLPGAPTGRIETPVTLVDVTASMLRWAGVEIPPEIAGRPMPTRVSDADWPGVDLLAVYSDEKLKPPENWEEDLKPTGEARNAKRSGCWPSDRVFGKMAALTRWPFKLIWFENYTAELYNLSWDPFERSNLADLRPEISGPLAQEARRLVDAIGLSDSVSAAEPPSAAKMKALRSLGYVREVAEVHQVDVELHDMRQRPAGCHRDGFEVLEDPLDLPLDRPLHHFHGIGVERDLAGEVDSLACLNRLGIASNRLRCIVGMDSSKRHGEDSSGVEARRL
jgi:arylsulfatase A-like enzyme